MVYHGIDNSFKNIFKNGKQNYFVYYKVLSQLKFPSKILLKRKTKFYRIPERTGSLRNP